MPGSVKAGLIFGVPGIVIVTLFSLVPGIGPFLCGPVGAAIIGGIAGFFGVRWSAGDVGVGAGVIAGTIAGLIAIVGAFVGTVVWSNALFNLILTDPQVRQQFEEQVRQSNPQATPEQIRAILDLGPLMLGLILGFCMGVLNLIAALALGALGGWIGKSSRPQPPPYAPQPQPPQPPFGPPPLSPP